MIDSPILIATGMVLDSALLWQQPLPTGKQLVALVEAMVRGGDDDQ